MYNNAMNRDKKGERSVARDDNKNYPDSYRDWLSKTKTPIFAKPQLNLKSTILNLKLNEHSC